MRKASGTQVGDRVEISLSFDADYRSGPAHPMPAELTRRLGRLPTARKAWDALAPSEKKEVLRYLARLKSAEAQTRNIERATRVLSGARERFLGRTWNAAPPRRRRSEAQRDEGG